MFFRTTLAKVFQFSYDDVFGRSQRHGFAFELSLSLELKTRLSGRTKRRNRSVSGMEENAGHLRVDSILGPVRMLVAKSRRFYFAGQPVELFRQTQTLFARHGPQCSYLF